MNTELIEQLAITASAVDLKQAKQLANAMKTLADIAKIYRKYGTSARFVPIAATQRTPKRAKPAPKPTGNGVCAVCDKRFVAKTADRCSCKVKR